MCQNLALQSKFQLEFDHMTTIVLSTKWDWKIPMMLLPRTDQEIHSWITLNMFVCSLCLLQKADEPGEQSVWEQVTYFTPGMSSMFVSPVQLMSSNWKREIKHVGNSKYKDSETVTVRYFSSCHRFQTVPIEKKNQKHDVMPRDLWDWQGVFLKKGSRIIFFFQNPTSSFKVWRAKTDVIFQTCSLTSNNPGWYFKVPLYNICTLLAI